MKYKLILLLFSLLTVIFGCEQLGFWGSQAPPIINEPSGFKMMNEFEEIIFNQVLIRNLPYDTTVKEFISIFVKEYNQNYDKPNIDIPSRATGDSGNIIISINKNSWTSKWNTDLKVSLINYENCIPEERRIRVEFNFIYGPASALDSQILHGKYASDLIQQYVKNILSILNDDLPPI